MQIIYGFGNCSQKKYRSFYAEEKTFRGHAIQKYHNLLINGFASNKVKVDCFSGLPLNRLITKKKWIHETDEIENGVHYHYYKSINLPFFRQLSIFLGGFLNVLSYKKTDDIYVVCDYLNVANAFGMAFASKLRRIPLCLIVTDLPEFEGGGKLLRRINSGIFSFADAFIFLTEPMNVRVNKRKKPYIVLEGHVDSSLDSVMDSKRLEYVEKKKCIVYAGSLKKIYGIEYLVKGFIQADLENTELIIYGDGDYRKELEYFCKQYRNVQYMGVRPNDEIVAKEQQAMLLVNPRPTDKEYTKYSFPSKNMEYMVSGTPVLTTKLPGMPKEYYPYVYLIEKESVDGFSEKLKEICSIPASIRYQKGESARRFVMKEKSNVIQAKKVIEFLNKL